MIIFVTYSLKSFKGIFTIYYVLWPQEFALSQVSDKIGMVIC